jgi:hypothetical protein
MRTDAAKQAGGCEATWQKNLAALKARTGELDFLPRLPHCPPPFLRVKFLPGEYPSLQDLSDEGRGVTLHSTRRAWAEAEELGRAAPVEKSRYLVALGL